jgi:hypothetical protein
MPSACAGLPAGSPPMSKEHAPAVLTASYAARALKVAHGSSLSLSVESKSAPLRSKARANVGSPPRRKSALRGARGAGDAFNRSRRSPLLCGAPGAGRMDCSQGAREAGARPPRFAGALMLTTRPRWVERAQDQASPRHNFAWCVWSAVPRAGDPWLRFAGRGSEAMAKRANGHS